MLRLPKGAPLYTQLPAAARPLPELVHELARRQFTGYVSCGFPAALSILLFESGRLIEVVLSRGGARFTGLEAMSALFESVHTDEGTLDAYRLSPDLALSLQALLRGEALYKAQELRLMDIKALINKVKEGKLTGCLRIYTAERSALILYRHGVPLGFFHDGAETIETNAAESQQIAKLPGAKVDVFATRGGADAPQPTDLLELIHVEKLWESIARRHRAARASAIAQAEEAGRQAAAGRLRQLTEQLGLIAERQLGRLGPQLVEKTLDDNGGPSWLEAPQHRTDFLAAVERGAKLLAGQTRVRALLEQLQGAIEHAFPPPAAPR